MAVPFRRTSKTKKRMRRTHLKKDIETTTVCKNCGAVIKPHRACSKCGYYKGSEVLTKKETTVEEPKKEEKKVKKTTKAKKDETTK